MNEKQEITEAIDAFSDEMKKRMLSKKKQGWSGWEHLTRSIYNGSGRLLMNAAKAAITGDKKSLVDVANLAMMIHRNER